MVSVTIGHGTSLMAPSIIRNTMTRPERMRPVQRAGLETGRVSAMTVMIDPRCLEWLFGFKTSEEGGNRQGSEIFCGARSSLLPLWEKGRKQKGRNYFPAFLPRGW